MSAHKESAVADDPLEVLFALHPKFNLMDFAGPFEVFQTALHDLEDEDSKAFDCTIACDEPKVMSAQEAIIGAQVTYKDAYKYIDRYDVVVVVGGNVEQIIKEGAEPLGLIKAYAELQESNPKRERTLMSICTGSFFLAKAGLLLGLAATTHPSAITKFEQVCSEAAKATLDPEPTDVKEDIRYVVNNLRFEIGDVDENPYVHRKSDASGRRPSQARKGSVSLKGSNARKSSIARREEMRLGGLRVITSGGVSAGVDAALYLVAALVSDEAAYAVAKKMQWDWKKGVVVDGLDL